MNKLIMLVALASLLSGCATSREVTIGKVEQPKEIRTAALVPQSGNSPEMDAIIQEQLMKYGIMPRPKLLEGTTRSTDADAIVTYADVWKWDLSMYLKSITINIFDAASGDLLVTGRWDNSPMHSFPDEKKVVKELLDDMTSKLKKNNTQK